MDYPAEMQRAAGDTREARREKRAARVEWLNSRQPAYPVRVETVYVDREGPERIVERLVEAKAKIDARETTPAPDTVPAYLEKYRGLNEEGKRQTDEQLRTQLKIDLSNIYGWMHFRELTPKQVALRTELEEEDWLKG